MAAPFKVTQREAIIAEVLNIHGITREELFGISRAGHLVEARMDIAQRLRAAEFSLKRIAAILHRDHTTVVHYLDESSRERKIKTLRMSRFKWLAPDIKELVMQIAVAEGVHPGALVAGWVGERARYEVEAKARAERTAA